MLQNAHFHRLTQPERAGCRPSHMGEEKENTIKQGGWRRSRFLRFLLQALEPRLPWSSRLLYVARAMLLLGVFVFFLVFIYALFLIPSTPDVADLRKAQVEQPSLVVSADGKILASFSRWNSEWVPIERISPQAIKALIATEDHRFYEHGGVDFFRTAASAVWTILGRKQGGSTITQQLARNRYPQEIGRSRSITRKLKEMITALKIESAYSKKEILETYLNTVPFFYNAHGIEMASHIYFNKSSAALNTLESATLIGMLKGSSYYNPVLNPERALQRRNVVLVQMVKRQALSQADFERLKTRPLELDFDKHIDVHGVAPHFAQHVRRWLIDWADQHDRNIHTDGLIVHTTIDSRMQITANKAMRRQMERLQAIADVEWASKTRKAVSRQPQRYMALRQRIQPFDYFWRSKPDLIDAFVKESDDYRRAVTAGKDAAGTLARLKKDERFMTRLRNEKTRLQAGLVVIEPQTGQVKAWVGSRDYGLDQFDHVITAQRQPGSTFKPFVYGAALEQGMSPDKMFTEKAVAFKLDDGSFWRPTDLSPAMGRERTMREGLVHSRNNITAQIMQEVGPERTAAFAKKVGVNQSWLNPVPSLALGTSPVTLMEMVSAYATVASGGEYRKPLYITRLTDKKGNDLLRMENKPERVVSETVAADLTEMMRGVVQEGTGARITHEFGITADVAGKTGTTQNNTDGWFILMHPKLVAGAWVGFNDSRVTMRSGYWGQGGHNALSLVGDFFKETLYPASNKGSLLADYDTSGSTLIRSVVKTISGWFGFGQKAPQEDSGRGVSTSEGKRLKSLRELTPSSPSSSAREGGAADASDPPTAADEEEDH